MALILLALGAVGHMVLWVALINRIHAVGIRRVWVDLLTLAFLFAIVFVPPAIGWALLQSARDVFTPRTVGCKYGDCRRMSRFVR